jgi:hypothetical protein
MKEGRGADRSGRGGGGDGKRLAEESFDQQASVNLIISYSIETSTTAIR